MRPILGEAVLELPHIKIREFINIPSPKLETSNICRPTFKWKNNMETLEIPNPNEFIKNFINREVSSEIDQTYEVINIGYGKEYKTDSNLNYALFVFRRFPDLKMFALGYYCDPVLSIQESAQFDKITCNDNKAFEVKEVKKIEYIAVD